MRQVCQQWLSRYEKIVELHKKAAPSRAAFDLVFSHCLAVAAMSVILARHRNSLYAQHIHGQSVRAQYAEEKSSFTQTEHLMSIEGCGKSSEINQLLIEKYKDYCLIDDFLSDYPIFEKEKCDGSLLASPILVQGGIPAPRVLNEKLVFEGALLHDIGAYFLLMHDGTNSLPLKFNGPHYIQHGLYGYHFSRENGMREELALFCRNHTGVGLHEEDILTQHLPLPADIYEPTTSEQETVMVADKYNSKSIPPEFLTAQAYSKKAAHFGEKNAQKWSILLEEYGTLDVNALAKMFGMAIRTPR